MSRKMKQMLLNPKEKVPMHFNNAIQLPQRISIRNENATKFSHATRIPEQSRRFP